MKKYFLLALVVLTGIASSCKYDDDELWDNVNDLADRITALETVTKQMNSDIVAMQSVITALQKQLTVRMVSMHPASMWLSIMVAIIGPLPLTVTRHG